MKANLITTILVFTFLFSNTVYAKNYKCHNESKKIKISVAKKLIVDNFYSNYAGKLVITELKNKDVWNKLETQIYRVEEKEIIFYAITNNKITKLGGSYSYNLDYFATDLDKDGKYEMIFSYQFGSGVSRGVLGVYSYFYEIQVGTTCVIPSNHSISHFVFDKKSDSEVYIYVDASSNKIMQGQLKIVENNKTKTLEIQ